jgi:hypothetical protein
MRAGAVVGIAEAGRIALRFLDGVNELDFTHFDGVYA